MTRHAKVRSIAGDRVRSGGSAAGLNGGCNDQDFEDDRRRGVGAGDGGGRRSAGDAGVGGRLGRWWFSGGSGGGLAGGGGWDGGGVGWHGGGWRGGGWAGGRSWHPGYWRGGDWYGGWWGPAIAAGVLAGAAVATYPYWGGGYGYGYGGGCWQVRPTYDAYGNYLGQQSVNVC